MGDVVLLWVFLAVGWEENGGGCGERKRRKDEEKEKEKVLWRLKFK